MCQCKHNACQCLQVSVPGSWLQEACTQQLEIGTYTTYTVKLVGSCMFHLVHPDTKCVQRITFYVASKNGSVLLSCVTMLPLGLIQPHTRLDYLPPRATLITSNVDHPKRTKCQVSVHASRKESEVSTFFNHKGMVPKLITSKEQILATYSDVFMVLNAFLVPHTISKLILVLDPSKPLADQSQCTLKKLSRMK